MSKEKVEYYFQAMEFVRDYTKKGIIIYPNGAVIYYMGTPEFNLTSPFLGEIVETVEEAILKKSKVTKGLTLEGLLMEVGELEKESKSEIPIYEVNDSKPYIIRKLNIHEIKRLKEAIKIQMERIN